MTGPEPMKKVKRSQPTSASSQVAYRELKQHIKQLKQEMSQLKSSLHKQSQLNQKHFTRQLKQLQNTSATLVKLQQAPQLQPELIAGGLGAAMLMIGGVLFVMTRKINKGVGRLHKLTSGLEAFLTQLSRGSSATERSPAPEHMAPASESTKSNEEVVEAEAMVEVPAHLQRLNQVLAFIPILNERPELLSALALQTSWADQQEDSSRLMLIINSINVNRVKRLHDQFAQVCLKEPTSACGTQDEAWPLLEWALELCNLSLPATKQVSLDRCAAGDRFDGRYMRATTDVVEGNIKHVLMPGISGLKIKSIVEV